MEDSSAGRTLKKEIRLLERAIGNLAADGRRGAKAGVKLRLALLKMASVTEGPGR